MNKDDLPRFLIFRFAPGAAGNMISSLLQCSPEVAHWNAGCQDRKPAVDWLDYFQQVFPKDMSIWLYHEPIGQLQWGTREIFSAKYPRGDDLDIQQFLRLEHNVCTQYYHANKQAGRYLPVFWHKPNMPQYFAKSRSVVIKIDSASLRWYDHAVYYKHHRVLRHDDRGILVRLLENRPEVVPEQFKNLTKFEQYWPSFRAFVRERILDNPFRNQYRNADLIPNWSIPSVMIELTDLLNSARIDRCYRNLCQALDITPVLNNAELRDMHSYWRNLHAI